MASMLCHRELAGFSTVRVQRGPSFRPRLVPFGRRCITVQAALKAPEEGEEGRKTPAAGDASGLKAVRILAGAVTGCFAWAALSGVALAALDGTDSVLGPTSETLLGTGHEFSFTSFLIYTLIGYWLIKAVTYLSQHTPDGPERDAKDKEQQQQQRGAPGMNDMGHAHIRSYVDSSQPAPGSTKDARELRNASLARSAAYRVTAAVRESQPRIHALVEELASPSCHWPPHPPRNLDIDSVAALVYSRVMQERGSKDPDGGMCPRERAALETQLLEEVAEKCAAEQVAQFVTMAAKGQLHSSQSGGGAGHPPPSHAH